MKVRTGEIEENPVLESESTAAMSCLMGQLPNNDHNALRLTARWMSCGLTFPWAGRILSDREKPQILAVSPQLPIQFTMGKCYLYYRSSEQG